MVVEDVIDAVGNHLAQGLVLKVMNPDFFGPALGAPLATAVAEIPDQFLLFRVHRDRRLLAAQTICRLGDRCSGTGRLDPGARIPRGFYSWLGGCSRWRAAARRPCPGRPGGPEPSVLRPAAGCFCMSSATPIRDRRASPARCKRFQPPQAVADRSRSAVARPAPGRRIRVASSNRCSTGRSSSASPAVIVTRDRPTWPVTPS